MFKCVLFDRCVDRFLYDFPLIVDLLKYLEADKTPGKAAFMLSVFLGSIPYSEVNLL